MKIGYLMERYRENVNSLFIFINLIIVIPPILSTYCSMLLLLLFLVLFCHFGFIVSQYRYIYVYIYICTCNVVIVP